MYIPFTAEQKERARQTDIAELLRQHGESLTRSGSEQQWLHDGQKVTIRGNLWFHQYEQQGGDAIDFVRRFYGKSFPEAMEFLLGDCSGSMVEAPAKPKKEKEVKPFELPPRHSDSRKAFAYLTGRGIDDHVLTAFANKGMIYEAAKYHNVVFVGFDPSGTPRHANKRGTLEGSTYKGNAVGSIPEYSFHWHGTDSTLFAFEAPIDLLSFITLSPENWKEHSYCAACSVSDRVVFQMLKDNPNIKNVILCYDNDQPGMEATNRICEKLHAQGVDASVMVPINKDWNEDLLQSLMVEESEMSLAM